MAITRTSVVYTFSISQLSGETVSGSIVIDDPDNSYSPFSDSDHSAAVDAYINSLLSAVPGTSVSGRQKTIYSNDKGSF